MANTTNLLASPHAPVIITGLAALGIQGELSDLQKILPFLKHEQSEVKAAATTAACTLILENLISRFNELQIGVRNKLGVLLESLDPSIVDEIGKDLYGDSDERRLRALQTLGLLRKNPRIREILAKLIQDRDVKIRATAVNLMGKVIGPNDHDLILSLLNDKDVRVRANTVEALESLGNKRIVPILLRFRKDQNNRIRGNVIKALYTLGFTDVEQDILDMLGLPTDLMKASALWVVAQIKLATKALEDAAGFNLQVENDMVVTNARKALIALATPRAAGFLRYLDQIPTA